MYRNITKNQYNKIIEEIDYSSLSDNDWIDLCKSSQTLYPLDEMSYNRGQFIGLCGNVANQITNNLIYILILGSYEIFYQYVHHWKTELMSYINKIYFKDVERSVKKDKIIFEYIIETYADPITYEYDNIEYALKALNDEIRKGINNKKYKPEVEYIKYKIIPNIDTEIELHKKEFANIYKSLIKAFKNKNINEFTKVLDQYII